MSIHKVHPVDRLVMHNAAKTLNIFPPEAGLPSVFRELKLFEYGNKIHRKSCINIVALSQALRENVTIITHL